LNWLLAFVLTTSWRSVRLSTEETGTVMPLNGEHRPPRVIPLMNVKSQTTSRRVPLAVRVRPMTVPREAIGGLSGVLHVEDPITQGETLMRQLVFRAQWFEVRSARDILD
jgi:hypothetical protein